MFGDLYPKPYSYSGFVLFRIRNNNTLYLRHWHTASCGARLYRALAGDSFVSQLHHHTIPKVSVCSSMNGGTLCERANPLIRLQARCACVCVCICSTGTRTQHNTHHRGSRINNNTVLCMQLVARRVAARTCASSSPLAVSSERLLSGGHVGCDACDVRVCCLRGRYCYRSLCG